MNAGRLVTPQTEEMATYLLFEHDRGAPTHEDFVSLDHRTSRSMSAG